MEQIFTIILYTHAVAGGFALLTGSLNMIRKKGDASHVKIGLIYFYTVLINACSACFLSVYHPNLFLFCLAVMSFYLVFTGRRFLMKSKNILKQEDSILDWLLHATMALFGLILIAYCILHIQRTHSKLQFYTHGVWITFNFSICKNTFKNEIKANFKYWRIVERPYR